MQEEIVGLQEPTLRPFNEHREHDERKCEEYEKRSSRGPDYGYCRFVYGIPGSCSKLSSSQPRPSYPYASFGDRERRCSALRNGREGGTCSSTSWLARDLVYVAPRDASTCRKLHCDSTRSSRFWKFLKTNNWLWRKDRGRGHLSTG